MAAAVLNVDYLSAYLNVDQQSLTTAIDSPTAELVRSILEAVTTKARDYEELAADKLRLDIELENAVRSSETRVQGLRANVEKAQKDVEEVRTKLNEEENARAGLESELQKLKSSSNTSTSEVEALRARISTLEASNRDTVAVLESKTTANDQLAKDLQKQHQKGLELSQQLTTLQQTVQTANSAVSSAKYREQSLKQEVELAKKNSEFFETELKTKNAEALKFRKEKGSRIAELQRLNEEATSNVEALKKTEQALRTRLDEIQKKAENSLEKVQQLEEAAAKSEEGFRQELESSRRLSELQAQQTETHRNRLKEVEAELNKVKDEAAEEIGHSRQEVESERQEREQAENRIAELEADVDRLEAQVSQHRAGSVPGTPRQGLNGSLFGRSGSPAPFATPGSVRSKSAVTATQAIEELYKVKGQLTTEKRRGDRLSTELDEMMQALEAKQPELEELQAEHERLQQEVIEMSKLADQSGKERERAKKAARMAEKEASTSQAEANILRQQIRDLSVQVKMLLTELDARERGLDNLSPAERGNMERLARGEVSEDAFEGLTATDKLISQRLTIFRSVSDLQEKNQELLKITRQLGAQMESEEALAAKHQAMKDHEEVQSLQTKIVNYKDELQAMLTRSESYIKERDMFRRMLQHRGQLPPNADLPAMFGQSVGGSTNGVMQTIEQNTQDGSNAVLLRELQAHFDQYRNEQGIDRRTMKEQIETLSKEKGTLQSEIAKTKSQLTLATERHDLLQANYAMIQKENVELQSRSQTLSEASAKQDLRTQQVAEDLIEAKGLLESMRNENANLKAEKKLYKEVQDRLNQDNESLMNERTRLNTLVANQQTIQNERELSESETRRRLQSQVEALETELSTTKRKLNDEVEDHKKTQLRKEYDSQQNQKRIDDLASSLSQVREELVAAKTTRDHLQSRVDELTIELKSAEERVELLQPRPTPRGGMNAGTDVNGINNEGDLLREQELAIEVSELKRDLELAKADVESATRQMEQYKSISQSSEEELQSLNATQDQYREEMDNIVGEKDTKIRELQQRVDEISAELTNTNNELTALRNQQGEVARQAEEEKTALEIEISRLKDEDEKHATAAGYHQQDLRAQAAIATKAQQDYEDELMKHAEAAKLLQNLRTEHNQLKSQSATLRAEAESAKLALSQSETSWEERSKHFEQQLKELRTSRDNLNSQNKILHQQLENVGAQISSLQQSRATADNDTSTNVSIDPTNDRAADGLREVNSFLRREKEIIEVQYDLKIQEAKRLQQQLEYAQSQLDESRLKLDQERRLHADGPRSSIAHKDLMDKLNELNLVREASVTLRNEARQAETRLMEKTKRVEELTEQIQPLEAKIRELEHGKETMDGEMRLLQEDRDRWQKRTQDIISKYDRIDPQDMEQLKETIESLRAERDSLLAEKVPLQEQISTLESDKAQWAQSRTKLIEQAKERNRINMKDNKDRTAERDTAIQERDALQEQLDSLRQELETAVMERDTVQQQVDSLNQEVEAAKSERDRALSAVVQPPEAPPAPDASSQSDPALDGQLASLREQLQQVTQERQSLQAQLQDLRSQLDKSNSDRDTALAEAVAAKTNHQIPDVTMQNGSEEGQIDEATNSGLSEEERKALEARIATAETKAKEQEDKAAQIEATMEATLKARSDKMKSALNKKLVESKETQKSELEAEYKLRIEQEKQIWLAESKSNVNPSANVNSPSKLVPGNPKQETASSQAVPATPTQKTHITFDVAQLSDLDVRDTIAKHPTAKAIVVDNIKKQVIKETQKLKDEHAKFLAELQQKAETSRVQAVAMETKKSALRINMFENKAKTAGGKLEIVEKAASTTPERAVGEVWEEVKAFKLPPPPPAAVVAAPASQIAVPVTSSIPTTNGSSVPPSQPIQGSEGSTAPATQASNIPSAPNGTASLPASNIPSAPQGNSGAIQRTSSIPMMRANASVRGRGGNQIYQPRGGQQGGRGRGGAQQPRGGMNAGAPTFSPSGHTGAKRPSEGPQGQGHATKRPRGGGN